MGNVYVRQLREHSFVPKTDIACATVGFNPIHLFLCNHIRNQELRQFGYQLDRFGRAHIQKLQEVIPVVNGWVLDAGYGEGSIVAELTRNKEVVGLDIDRASIKIAKSKHPNMDFIVAVVLHMPFSAHFTAVVANAIIDHVPSARCFLQEVMNILVKGGYVALSTPNRHRISNIARLLLNRLRRGASYPYKVGSQVHPWEYTLPEIRSLLNIHFSVILLFGYILGYHRNFCLSISPPTSYVTGSSHWRERNENIGIG